MVWNRHPIFHWQNKQSILGQKTAKEIENIKAKNEPFEFLLDHKKTNWLKKCAKKLLDKCNYENNQYFYEYSLYCAIKEFLFQAEKLLLLVLSFA